MVMLHYHILRKPGKKLVDAVKEMFSIRSEKRECPKLTPRDANDIPRDILNRQS